MAELEWSELERFGDLKVGEMARLVRPEFVDEEAGVTYAEYVGVVTAVNPRGELELAGHFPHFFEDAVFGDWFWRVYRGVTIGSTPPA